MPKRIIKPILHPIKELSESGKLGGVLLICATLFSILISNSNIGAAYLQFWHQPIGVLNLSLSIEQWVNDLLMAVFFFLVGMEIKREIVVGELSSTKKALLPMIAALGGMLVPALIYTTFNAGTENTHGWAIPTATDIAFSLGILSLLGNRVPLSLKVFLAALAIIDDLGGILIIAIFYTQEIQFLYLVYAAIILFVLWLLNRFRVTSFGIYLLPMLLLWYCIFCSGVHATIAGVLSSLFIPISKIERYENTLHKPVNYLILPIFALANTTIVIAGGALQHLISPLSLGITLALFIGKPLGIFAFVYLSVKTKICTLQQQTTIRQILGLAMLAGIGFTMSLFFTSLSFKHPESANTARLAIIIGSSLSAVGGLMVLSISLKKENASNSENTNRHKN